MSYDGAAMSCITLLCSSDSIWYGDLGDTSTCLPEWSDGADLAECPAGTVICGLRTQVQEDQGEVDDDKTLNGVKFKCCQP
jgi:hypothetical protein